MLRTRKELDHGPLFSTKEGNATWDIMVQTQSVVAKSIRGQLVACWRTSPHTLKLFDLHGLNKRRQCNVRHQGSVGGLCEKHQPTTCCFAGEFFLHKLHLFVFRTRKYSHGLNERNQCKVRHQGTECSCEKNQEPTCCLLEKLSPYTWTFCVKNKKRFYRASTKEGNASWGRCENQIRLQLFALPLLFEL